MIIPETINGVVFLEQRRWFMYLSEEHRKRDEYFLSTSDFAFISRYIREAKQAEKESNIKKKKIKKP